MRKKQTPPKTQKKPRNKPKRTKARHVPKAMYWLLTRRCTQRQYLLTPEPDVLHVLKYAIALAAARTNVEIIDWTFMSNHYHIVLFDPDGRAPEFAEQLNRLVARVLNAHWGRRENFWSSERCGLTRLGTEEDVMDKIIYTLTNPTKDYLVDRIEDWPGLTSWSYLDGKPEVVERPEIFFRSKDGAFASTAPDHVTLKCAQPRFSIERGETWAQWADEKRAAVKARESQIRAAKPKNCRIVGQRAILAQKYVQSPNTPANGRKLNPSIACKDKKKRIEMRLELRGFRAQYRAAFEDMREGKDTPFPYGTYGYVRLGIPIRVDPEPKAA